LPPAVKLSMTLPTMLPHTRADALAWCRGIDAGPWESLAVPERITYTSHDLTVQLAAAAALTERVRLWTTIIVLPAHDAVAVAKQMASVDVLTNGRLTVGVGIGGREDDYRAINASFARRYPRMDEQVATMRRIWAGEPPFEGADPVGPPPVQPGGPPLVAGAFGPKGIARAARWAVGVNGAWTLDGNRDAMAAAFDLIRGAWRDAGREEPPHLSSSIWYALGDDAESQLRSYAFDYLEIFGGEIAKGAASMATCFGADALRSAVSNARDAGADEFFLVPTTSDPAELQRTVAVLGDDFGG
jgi:alkanesulfonate monooxygenase SsuD/methylene tetrahydromethanopterin reductase-like flavin-dependent oxidoreductase (luciferase family)